MLQTSVRIINLTTLSIVFKRGSIGCIFVLKHNFLQLGHDSLSKQRRSLTPRSHHVSFTTETRTTCYRGGKHRSTQTCRLETWACESRCERKKNRRVTFPQVIDLHWESGSNQRSFTGQMTLQLLCWKHNTRAEMLIFYFLARCYNARWS